MRPVPTPRDDYERIAATYEAGSLELTRERLQPFLRAHPSHVPALLLGGVVEAQLLNLDAALAAFDRVLAIDPDNAAAQFNKAGVLLTRGEWEAGLPLYESRWRLPELSGRSSAGSSGRAPAGGSAASRPIPWRGGESLAGRRILLRSEQGLGDTLQFCRYVPLVAGLGAGVILQVQRPLVTLLADLPGVSRIVTVGAPLPDCDHECPLLSLPLAFGTTPATIPGPRAYLPGDPGKVSDWRARLGTAAGLRVGLAWRGGAARAHHRRRTLPLQRLLEWLPRAHRYHSLQKELPEEEARVLSEQPWIADHRAELHDFSDTAALCACLDVVISVDTSVAHLAAGLGRPTWVLLPYSAAWHWLLDRTDSPWYPSAVLFRQPRPDDWDHVGTQVAARLQALARLPSAPG